MIASRTAPGFCRSVIRGPRIKTSRRLCQEGREGDRDGPGSGSADGCRGKAICAAAVGDSGRAPGGASARGPHRGGVLGEMQEFDKSRRLTKLAEGSPRSRPPPRRGSRLAAPVRPRLAREARRPRKKGPARWKQELSHPRSVSPMFRRFTGWVLFHVEQHLTAGKPGRTIAAARIRLGRAKRTEAACCPLWCAGDGPPKGEQKATVRLPWSSLQGPTAQKESGALRDPSGGPVSS